MSKDYYNVLGVSRDASQDEIKSAFKKLAKKHHPDRNRGNKEKAEEEFKKINEAYDILGDPQKRKSYDMGGFDQGGSGGGWSGFGGAQSGFGGVNFEDIFGGFEDIFGSGGGNRSSTGQSQRGDDLQYNSTITLEEAFNGKEESISFTSFVPCNTCSGTGSKDGKMSGCTLCNGSGVSRFQKGFFILEETCKSCSGSGKIPAASCMKCSGDGRVKEKRTITFDIPSGIHNDMSVKLSGKGGAGKNGSSSGDLYVKIHIKGHEYFDRDGDNLICHVPVHMQLLALGGKIHIPNLDNEDCELNIVSGTHSGEKFVIKSKGMKIIKSGGRRGDLIVILDAITPSGLNKEQKAHMLEMERLFSDKNYKSKHGLFGKIKTFIKN